jgi:membrane protein implicated in regulation of membrane protease activity/DNA-binding ferritin-like protein (Dps family)
VTDDATVVERIERYWLETGVPHGAVVAMRAELEQHLADARVDGRTLTDVVGNDTARFAESWAAAYRAHRRSTATWGDVQTGRAQVTRKTRRELLFYGIGLGAVIAAVAVAGQGGNDVDNEVWRWLWTIFALVMGIGEIFTAGFFLLPFAIGAAAAAILSWAGAAILAQWLVFFGVSLFSLAYLRRFITRQDEAEQPKVGANRWIGSEGIVLQDIDPASGAGMVKIESEEWRATGNQGIPAGQRIAVVEVRGARLVVEPLENE